MVHPKRLRSVIQSVAHHSWGPLCFLHPDLGQACKSQGLDEFMIDLIGVGARSETEIGFKLIGGALEGLRNKFSDILQAENMSLNDLSEATAKFRFYKGPWPSSCYVRVVDALGREFDIAVADTGNTCGHDGKSIESIKYQAKQI